MTALIENLMLLARADTGTETLDFRALDLGALGKDVCVQARMLADSKQIRFDATIPETPIVGQGDPHALRRLLLILIDNAVKYTSPGGNVSLTIKPEREGVEFRVLDNGIGIPEEDLPHIFERFYRSDKARTRALGGTGLGLSIGQWIVQAHGGEIRAESSPQGTVFRVHIPLTLQT